MSKILFLDLETTGFSREWDYIIEVAALLYDTEKRKVINQFHEYIRPGKRIPQKITEITGITEFMVRESRTEREVLADFFEWISDVNPDILAAYNAPFDRSFLEIKKTKYQLFAKEKPWEDMMKYGRQLKREGKTENYKQTTVAEYLNIEYQAHSAIEDVRALIQIYEKLGLNKSTAAIRKELGF